MNLVERLKKHFDVESNVLITGAHGVGKTSIIKQVFEDNGLVLNESWLYFSGSTLDPWVDFIGIPKEIDGYLRTYFDTSIREGRYMSEDWNFCENWRDLGGKVWLDTKVQLGHTGSYMYGLGAQEKTYKTLHNFYKGTSVQISE